MNHTQPVGGVPFSVATPQQAAQWVAETSLKLKSGIHIHLANAYTVALADKSAEYRETLTAGAVNFPDGKPVGAVSALRRDRPRLHQVRGPQLMLDTLAATQKSGARSYFLGSTSEVLTALERNVRAAYPHAKIVGIESPPFRALSERERADQIERIRASGANIVWVGLGTPKQDVVARELAAELPVAAVAVGAAFDFAAGTLKPSPQWVRSVGLEWAHRLYLEPRRLWRRYLFGNSRFLLAAIRWGRRED
ncbi:WecB/TagA/CpsF family glycosyltransferase [Microbacterium aurantiacum]|uniref:WecB/TagA/CpsF family glycosyltransferase n=1 Tax=Microbacterium aurantiacum TaxID=162393 RepID=A0AAJ2HDR8_9MICO|nr:WecB/TagA/CpsF family glycosyltransferase [Microbacterium aurantiacum]MDS0244246.1 WecB/TagA/CpsF family glycosyltransferase [Microbacterium aurantiacum]